MYAVSCRARAKTDSLEPLELVLTGCVGKGAKNHCVVALDHYRPTLIKEGFLALVIRNLSDAYSYVVEELNTVAVDGSHYYYYHHISHW